MSKAFANTKLFAASAILFAVATIFNLNMNASETSANRTGLMMAPTQTSEPVVKIGPTLPPSPWDDDSPPTNVDGSQL